MVMNCIRRILASTTSLWIMPTMVQSLIPVGSYTIVEEKYGKVSKSGEEGLWGRIKSEQPYNGKYVPVWICLSYTEKV